MSVGNSHPHMTGLSRRLADLVSSPTMLVVFLVAPLVIIAWVWLIVAVQAIATSNAGASLGPSMQMLEPLLRSLDWTVDNRWVAYLVAICTPSTFSAGIGVQSVVPMFIMWLVMTIAMMLPTAAPMLRTYADIADVAGKRGKAAVPLLVLAGGYLTIWLGFAVLATALQMALMTAGKIKEPTAPLSALMAGGLLMLAGLYQFSAYKNACLVKCRNPFTVIFAQWSILPRDIFRLGIQQGLHCLGCCWAIMLLMLAVGTMNLIWIAFLTLFTLIEKTSSGNSATRIFGVVLLAWGLFLVLTSTNLSV